MFGLRSARPATERLDPGDHLGEVERLGEVVVGAQSEPLDPVLDRTGRGEHQNPARRALGGQGTADLVAVGAGEVPVEDHDVVAAGAQAGQGVVAVQRHVDDHPVAAQPRRDGPGQPLVVLRYQHSHGHKMPRRGSQPGHNCDGVMTFGLVHLSPNTASTGRQSR